MNVLLPLINDLPASTSQHLLSLKAGHDGARATLSETTCKALLSLKGGHDRELAALSEMTRKALPTLVAEKLAEICVTLND
jgi:hypothetical protein